MDFSFIFAQVGGACTLPNPIQWAAIISLIAGAGVFALTTGVSAIAIATTVVSMIVAGASIDSILAAISGHTIVAKGGAEALTSIITTIIGILGC